MHRIELAGHPAYPLDNYPIDEAPDMRIFLGVLSALALLLAARRFSISEHTGREDIGALFLLLIGIQLLVAAALVHLRQEDRTKQPPNPTDEREGSERDQR